MLTLRASPLLYTKQDYIIDMLPCHINNVPSTLYQGLFIRVVGHIASRKNIANVANVYSMILWFLPLTPTPYPLPLTPELAYPLSPTPYPRISLADLVLQQIIVQWHTWHPWNPCKWPLTQTHLIHLTCWGDVMTLQHSMFLTSLNIMPKCFYTAFNGYCW